MLHLAADLKETASVATFGNAELGSFHFFLHACAELSGGILPWPVRPDCPQ